MWSGDGCLPNNKYIVEIDKDAKRLKRVFDELRVNSECVIESCDSEWHGPMRQLGLIIKKKNLIENGFIEPMWVHINKQNNIVEKRLIRLKPDVEIERKVGNANVYFKFRRRKLVP